MKHIFESRSHGFHAAALSSVAFSVALTVIGLGSTVIGLGSTLIGLGSALAVPGAAQELDVFADDVQVRVVSVDTVVTDKKGEPVTGLVRDDFELLVDGKPVPITHFSDFARETGGITTGGITTGGVATPAPAETSAVEPAAFEAATARLDQPVNLIVYLDRAYLQPGDTTDLGIALRQFLEQGLGMGQGRGVGQGLGMRHGLGMGHGLGTGDRVMLVSADRKIEVLQGLTTQTSSLDPFLARELLKQGRGMRIESEYRDILRSIGQVLEQGTESNARHPEHYTQALLARINGFSEEVYRDVEVTSRQLRQLIAGLAGVEGRNVVLYIGGRMPINAGQTLFAAWQSAFGRNSTRWQTRFQGAGAAATSDATAGGNSTGFGSGGDSFDGVLFDSMAAPDANLDASEALSRTAQLASAYGIRFYTLDAAGLRTSPASTFSRGSHALTVSSGGSQWDYRQTQRIQSQAALADLAEITGGRALGASRNFASLLGDMRQDLERIYSLGFEPPQDAESHTHKIEVRLSREARKRIKARGIRIRHRQLVRGRTVDQEAAEKTLSALLFGSQDNPLRVEVSAAEGEAANTVLLTIKVPLAHLALVAEGRVHTGKLTVFVTSGDMERGATPIRKAVVPVRIANEEIMNVLGRHLEYTLNVEVEPGSRSIAIGVRDDYAPLLSTVRLPVASATPAAAVSDTASAVR